MMVFRGCGQIFHNSPPPLPLSASHCLLLLSEESAVLPLSVITQSPETEKKKKVESSECVQPQAHSSHCSHITKQLLSWS